MTEQPFRRLTPVIRLAPAKVNLTLAVVGRRSDGFHALHSVMVPLALADRLSAVPNGGEEDTLHVTGADAGPDAENLALRAVLAARDLIGTGPGRPPTPGLSIRLEKHVPVAAGLAGGSSDAAAAVDAALEAWGASDALDADRRLALAARLGSDVPFFLGTGPALVEGRGERVTRLSGVRGPSPGVLLITPALRVSTAAVFAAFDASMRPGDPATRVTSAHLAEELGAGLDAQALVVRAGILAVANDLLHATEAVAPGTSAFRRGVARRLARPVGQSGSGPSCWALYPSVDGARIGADALATAFADGSLPFVGDGPPFVVATSILGRDQHGGDHDA